MNERELSLLLAGNASQKSVYLPDALWAEVQRRATELNRSAAWIVRRALLAWLAQDEPEAKR